MLILSNITPPSVTNLSQRPFFSWLAWPNWILPCIMHQKAAPLVLDSILLDH